MYTSPICQETHVDWTILSTSAYTYHSTQWYQSLHYVAQCPCRRQQHGNNLLRGTVPEDWCDGWSPHNWASLSTAQVQSCQSVNTAILHQRCVKLSTACATVMLDKNKEPLHQQFNISINTTHRVLERTGLARTAGMKTMDLWRKLNVMVKW